MYRKWGRSGREIESREGYEQKYHGEKTTTRNVRRQRVFRKDCVVDSLSKSINEDARDDRLEMNLSLEC